MLIQIARTATIFNVDEVVVFDELGSTLARSSCVCTSVCMCMYVCTLQIQLQVYARKENWWTLFVNREASFDAVNLV